MLEFWGICAFYHKLESEDTVNFDFVGGKSPLMGFKFPISGF